MARRLEERLVIREFNQSTEIHDANNVGHVVYDCKIVTDEQVGQAKFILQIFHQVENLRLNRDVERRSRFVTNQKSRPGCQGTGYGDALALTAGKLVRVLFSVG